MIHKTAFKKFISKYRSSKTLMRMLKEFEKSTPYEPTGFLYKLIRNQNSADYKTYLRFKNHLFEFELSSKRIDFFKKDDLNSYLHSYLMKELLTANILIERSAYFNANQSLNEIYKKAEKYELLEIQKPCAKSLTQFYQYTSQKEAFEEWSLRTQKISEEYRIYEKRIDDFEIAVHRLKCCAIHNENMQNVLIMPYKSTYKRTRLLKMKWMHSFLEAKVLFRKKQYQDSLNLCFELKRMLENEPGLFPLHYKLIMYLLSAENLWFLKKFYAVNELSYKAGRLDIFSMHQRIPALYMALCYFLHKRRYEHIEIVCGEVKSVLGFGHFKEYLARIRMIELMVLFNKKEYRKFLKKINRSNNYIGNLCAFNLFLLRTLELCCLHILTDGVSVDDKFESLRRYVGRNNELKTDLFCKLILKTCRKWEIKGEDHLKAFNKYIKLSCIHDLRWLVVDFLLRECLSLSNLNNPQFIEYFNSNTELEYYKKA